MSFYLPSSSAHVPGKKKKKGKKRRQQGCMVSTARPQANTEVGRWSCVGCLLLPRVTLISVVALSALTANGAGVAVLGWALRCPLSRAGLGHPGLPGLGAWVGSPRAALAPQDKREAKLGLVPRVPDPLSKALRGLWAAALSGGQCKEERSPSPVGTAGHLS